MKMFLLIGLIVLSLGSKGQFNFEWGNTLGGGSDDASNSVAVDSDNNVYTVGYFSNSIIVGPSNNDTLGAWSSNSTTWITKYDSLGNYIWAKQFEGTGGTMSYKMVIDNNNDIILTGMFSGTVDFDPSSNTYLLTSGSYSSAFVCKLSSNGSLLWVNMLSNNDYVSARAIDVDNQNAIYVTGIFSGNVDFDFGPATNNLTGSSFYIDAFILKVTPSGNFVWVKQISGSGGATPSDIHVSKNLNDVYITGDFQNTMDFNVGGTPASMTSNGVTDIFICKLNQSGNFQWVKVFGGIGEDVGKSVVSDYNGNSYIIGDFKDQVDFNTGSGSNVFTNVGLLSNIFLVKLNSMGNLIWAKEIGSTGAEEGNSIVIDQYNNLYMTGSYNGGVGYLVNVDFNPSSGIENISSSVGTAFLLKIDTSGNFHHVEGFQSNGYSFGSSIALDNSYNIIMSGKFKVTIDLDPSNNSTFQVSSNGSYDAFTIKFNQCIFTNSTIQSVESCGPYEWIDGNIYYASDSSSTFVATNIYGCDSLVLLNFAGPILNTGITSLSDFTLWSDEANADSYQWLDCDNDFSPISGLVDQYIYSTTSGNFAVQIIKGQCTDTSYCYSLPFVSVEDYLKNLEVSIYPNPVSENININFDEYQENIKIEVVDVSGQLLYSNEYSKVKNAIIDFSTLSKGIYFLNFNIDGMHFYKKVLKN